MDDQLGWPDLGDRQRSTTRQRARQAEDRPLPSRVEIRGRTELGLRRHRALAVQERHIELDVERKRSAVGGAEEVDAFPQRGDGRDGGAAQTWCRRGCQRPASVERGERHDAVPGDNERNRPILVDPDRVARGSHRRCRRRPIGADERRRRLLEERIDLGGDDDEDGQDRGDDDDATENDESRRDPVEQDSPTRAGAADAERAGRRDRLARSESF